MRTAQSEPQPRRAAPDVLKPQVFSQIGMAQLHLLAAFSADDPQYFRVVIEECIAHRVGGDA